MRFTPPAPAERLAAIGPTEGLPEVLRRALDPADDFRPVPAPGPGDWLAAHPEPGQSFEEFARSGSNRPDRRRSRFYLQPIGEFGEGAPPLERLREFAAAFFRLEVEVLPTVDPEGVTSRRNPHGGQVQLLTRDLLALLARGLPADAYALLGITLEDLYPDPAWNFVFGQASLRERVGVYSFARYDPAFYGEEAEDRDRLMLRRSCRVLAHETAHMFGIAHCVYYHCLMNGSNHLEESDARPFHLCPVDLRKLHASVGFDVVERYRRLLAFHQQAGFPDEAEWLRERIRHVTGTSR